MLNRIRKLIKILLPRGVINKIRKLISIGPFIHHCIFNKTPIPNDIVVNPINFCNLNCPLCARGTNKVNYDNIAMSMGTFKTIIEKMPRLKHITLYHWGEPFLNPDIFEMIKYAKKRSIQVSIHTNFSLKKNDYFFLKLVQSKLDFLTVAIDGASQESYSKYRKGGDFRLVIHNVEALMKAKKHLKSKIPMVMWKFIVNRFNEKEIGKAQSMARRLGMKFEIEKMGLSDMAPKLKFDTTIERRKKDWLPKNKKFVFNYYKNKYKKPFYKRPCDQLFTTLVVNPDGKVFPCCFTTDKNDVFGDLLADSIENIWNNDKYRYSRSLFGGKKYLNPKIQTICSKCNNFKKVDRQQ